MYGHLSYIIKKKTKRNLAEKQQQVELNIKHQNTYYQSLHFHKTGEYLVIFISRQCLIGLIVYIFYKLNIKKSYSLDLL